MAEYINREAVLKEIGTRASQGGLNNSVWVGVNFAYRIVENYPKADVMSIGDHWKLMEFELGKRVMTGYKTGRWEQGVALVDGEYYIYPKCSACGKLSSVLYEPDFCPNCGADMRSEP